MSGRFFAVPLFFAACLLSLQPRIAPSLAIPLAAAIVVIGFLRSTPTVLSDSSYKDKSITGGIVDERAYYYQENGMLTGDRLRQLDLDWPMAADKAPAVQGVKVLCGGLGVVGLREGPFMHLVDDCGIADPLLARLPAVNDSEWRIGHFYRRIPGGYLDSVRTAQNVLVDDDLREYYEKIRLLTRSQLWSSERLMTIARMNLGSYDDLIDQDYYRATASDRLQTAPGDPDTAVIDGAALSQRKSSGAQWNAAGNVEIITKRLAVQFDNLVRDRQWLDISLDHNDAYRVVFAKDNEHLEAIELGPAELEGGGLFTYRHEIPLAIQEQGFDSIVVEPLSGDGFYSIGHLLFE